MAALGEHRLGVELHALDGELAVPQRHDHPTGRTCRHLELVRYRGRLHRQRVIAGRGERVGQAVEDPGAVVLDQTGLAVQQLGSAGSPCAPYATAIA